MKSRTKKTPIQYYESSQLLKGKIGTVEFKDILKDLRVETGLTQDQLAKDINFSMSIVNKWENGKKNPSVQALKILAKYFNVSTDYLLGLEN